MLRQFVRNQCVSKGMCADYAIHDTDGHNPHAHIMLTVRPLDDRGKWLAKTQKEYLCRRGEEEQGFTAAEFRQAQLYGGKSSISIVMKMALSAGSHPLLRLCIQNGSVPLNSRKPPNSGGRTPYARRGTAMPNCWTGVNTGRNM